MTQSAPAGRGVVAGRPPAPAILAAGRTELPATLLG